MLGGAISVAVSLVSIRDVLSLLLKRLEFQIFLLIFLVCRDAPGLLEPSGMLTVLNNARSQTPDRLSSCSDTRRVRVSNTSTRPSSSLREKGVCLSYYFLTRVRFGVCMQPDGAESVASLYSSDTASDKRDVSHHTHNSGTPTISVSRASVSSGTDRHLRLRIVMCDIITQLLTSHATTTDVFGATLPFHTVQ